MFIRDAKTIADRLTAQMSPYCLKVEIGGSIRRGRQDVKDIEIVASPRWEESSLGLFSDGGERLNKLLQWALGAELAGDLAWIKPGTPEIIPWEPKRHGKYWRAMMCEGIKLDLFLCEPANFGLIYLIRTGSAEFSQGVMTHAKHSTNYRVVEGWLTDKGSGSRLHTPTERDVFGMLRLDYVEPAERTGFAAVKREGRAMFPEGYRIAGMVARGLA